MRFGMGQIGVAGRKIAGGSGLMASSPLRLLSPDRLLAVNMLSRLLPFSPDELVLSQAAAVQSSSLYE